MAEEQINRELDLRGEVCPYTFVKAKLALEEMEMGQVLRLVVDHEPALQNVPRAITLEGQHILRVGELGQSEWEILIRKDKP